MRGQLVAALAEFPPALLAQGRQDMVELSRNMYFCRCMEEAGPLV